MKSTVIDHPASAHDFEHLDASHSPAQPAFLPSPEDADFDSSVSRLLRKEANESDLDSDLDGDLDSVPGAEDEPESAPRRRRPRVPEYIPRRRNHGELRELIERVDYHLTDLHEPDLRVRDHPPPPELLYESFDEALAGVIAWAKDHGVSYNRHNWAKGGRYRLLMTCHRRGKPREAGASSVSRKRPGAMSQRTGCKMQFWLVANDYTQLDGQ
ncbi:hypothetical protein E4U59_006075 [Claviceps monticola]|nr:hypothetical protein E4U59_006075 [Claviceps monticola]